MISTLFDVQTKRVREAVLPFKRAARLRVEGGDQVYARRQEEEELHHVQVGVHHLSHSNFPAYKFKVIRK
jgi:hypothetical protein